MMMRLAEYRHVNFSRGEEFEDAWIRGWMAGDSRITRRKAVYDLAVGHRRGCHVRDGFAVTCERHDCVTFAILARDPFFSRGLAARRHVNGGSIRGSAASAFSTLPCIIYQFSWRVGRRSSAAFEYNTGGSRRRGIANCKIRSVPHKPEPRNRRGYVAAPPRNNDNPAALTTRSQIRCKIRNYSRVNNEGTTVFESHAFASRAASN